MAGLFGDMQLNIDPLTLGLFGMAAGFGGAPRGFGSTVGAGFGGLAQGLSLGQKYQMNQAEMDYKRTQEARAQQELAIKQRQQEQQENFWKNFPGAGASPTGLPVAPGGAGAAPYGGFADRMIGLESGGDPNARNPMSSATGAGQFINGTWLDLLRRNKPEIASARNDEFLLALRSDPALSREMVGVYGEENGAKLKAAGLPDNDTTRALAHRFGAQGAIQVLTSPAETPVASVVGDQVIRANPDLAGKTAGDVVGWYAQRMGGGGQQQGAQAAQPAPDPWAAGQRKMAEAGYAARGEAMGLVKPGMAAQLRAEAEQLMQRGRVEVTQWQGRWVKRDRVTGDITPIQPEELERIRTAGGIEQLKPRGQAAGLQSYPVAPPGYRQVTDAAGNIVGQEALAGGPADLRRPGTNPLGEGPVAQSAGVLRRLAPAIEQGKAGPEDVTLFRQALDIYTQERVNPDGLRVPGLPIPPEINRAARSLVARDRADAPAPAQQAKIEPSTPGAPPPPRTETAPSGSTREVKPVVVSAQDRERWSKIEGETGKVEDAIKGFRSAFSDAGTGINAFINNPRDPKATKLNAAYSNLMTAMRGEAFLNTGVLQPGEIRIIDKLLLNPQSIRGLLASKEGMGALLDEIEGFVKSGRDRQRRVILGEGYAGPASPPAGFRVLKVE